ncbi:MAG: hypothetical protein GXY55_00790 [Phycisphaerae bacterium]|nr:hypothetical protein [Phycisphaerae bacterium]
MRLRYIALLIVPLILSVQGRAEDNSFAEEAEGLYGRLVAARGSDYLALRERLLGMDHDRVKSFLEAKHKAVADPIESLCIEALLARLNNPEELQKTLDEGFAWAAKDRRKQMRNPYGLPPTEPMPGLAAGRLVTDLGDAARAYACELLVHDLIGAWEQWQKLVPVILLQYAGQTVTYPPPTPDNRSPRAILNDIRDIRAGHALLWVIENREDDISEFVVKSGSFRAASTLGELAARYCLRHFRSEAMAAAVRSARDKASTPEKQARLSEALELIENELHMWELSRQRLATQPATVPADSPATRPE